MIGFVTVGTHDLPCTATFYDHLFGAIHGYRIYSSENGVVWSLSHISPGFGAFTSRHSEQDKSQCDAMIAPA